MNMNLKILIEHNQIYVLNNCCWIS